MLEQLQFDNAQCLTVEQDSLNLRMVQLFDQQCVAIEAQDTLIVALQGRLSFMEDQMGILIQDCAPCPNPTPEVIDLTDEDESDYLSEGTSVEIKGIGGLIDYVQISSGLNDPSQEELEQVRVIQGLPIPERDYSGPMAAVDQEADMIVRAGIVAPSYDCPPPYLSPYECIEYHLQW